MYASKKYTIKMVITLTKYFDSEWWFHVKNELAADKMNWIASLNHLPLFALEL